MEKFSIMMWLFFLDSKCFFNIHESLIHTILLQIKWEKSLESQGKWQISILCCILYLSNYDLGWKHLNLFLPILWSNFCIEMMLRMSFMLIKPWLIVLLKANKYQGISGISQQRFSMCEKGKCWKVMWWWSCQIPNHCNRSQGYYVLQITSCRPDCNTLHSLSFKLFSLKMWN